MATNPLTGQTDVTDPVARVLLAHAMQQRPMYHWAEPLGRLAQFGVGAFIEEGRRKGEESEMKDWLGALPGLTTPGAAPAAATPGPPGPRPQPMDADVATPAPSAPGSPSRDIAAASQPGRPSAPAIPRAGIPGAPTREVPIEAAKAAIASKESGSPQGDYSALGPPTVKGNPNSPRALGKYQVMPGNVGPWTQEVLGRTMTPEEFLASPEAQERVFEAKFGQLMKQYGFEGAARAWFTGSPTGNGRDVLGTTGDRYVADTTRALPPGAAPAPGGQQVAQAPAPAAPTATPSMTDVTRQPGAIPPEVAAHIRKGLASKNPRVRAAAMGLYQQYATPDKPTDEARNYALYARQEQAAGRPVKSMYEWMLDLRRAGAPPTGEKSYEIETGKAAAKAVSEARDAAGLSMQTAPQLSRMLQLLDAVRTGPLAGQQLTWGRIANTLKVDIGALGLSPDQVANAEELQSLALKQLTAVAKTLGANPTNYDAKLIEQMLPSLGKSVEGNRQIIATLQRAIRFQQVYAAEIEKWADANKGSLSGFTTYFADKYANGIPMRGGQRTSPPTEGPLAAPPPPAAAPPPAAPERGAAPPPDAQGRRWAEDALGRRYYTPDGGKTWFNSDGTPFQPQGQR